MCAEWCRDCEQCPLHLQGSEEKVGDESSAEAAEDADILVPPLEVGAIADIADSADQQLMAGKPLSHSNKNK